MKLLMKEWKLCMHPTGYLMPLMAGLVLVPGYPYGVCCFYVGLSIFFICLTAREDHDAGYTLMLPVSRQDAVRARILFCAGLDVLGLPHSVPQGSYFVMADISPFLEKERFAGWTDLQFCEWMIREVGVAAVPGSSFFAEDVNNLIRLHFARSEASLTEAVTRLQKLKKYL